MEKEHISQEEFDLAVAEICDLLENRELHVLRDYFKKILSDTRSHQECIDRDYISNLRTKRQRNKIDDINRMLAGMSLEQITNVHKYTSDEYDEPNHEAEALEAIIQLSRKNRSEKKDG